MKVMQMICEVRDITIFAHFFITHHSWTYYSHLFSLGPANGFTPENPGMLI